ncbi:hypothetical protein L208DRAFT_1323385, partial [Tricholoma matsutake]
CYGIATTFQEPRSLDAPSTGSKYGDGMDADVHMRKDILELGVFSAMKGLEQGPERLVNKMHTQAVVANMPRIGMMDNICYPVFQLNIAAAVSEHPKSVYTVNVFKWSLGHAAGTHIDGSDSPACPTALSNWSKPHPDVDEELFSILDWGISWVMEEFSMLYFSGLHFHGGSQPFYCTPCINYNMGYNCLMLIGYPPNESFNGTSSMVFAALPDRKLLKSYQEMQLPA